VEQEILRDTEQGNEKPREEEIDARKTEENE
jgi:hypothetical protein